MSYSLGQVEIDLTGGRPYYPPPAPTYIRTDPPTQAETAAGLVIGVALIGLLGVAIWKAPRGSWGPAYYAPQPALRIRMNKRRRRTSRRRRSR